MKKNVTYALLLTSLLPLVACASIVDGDRQLMSVNTENCKNAECKLSNEQGTYYITKTPDTVMVNKSTTPMSIKCSKGNASEIITVESSTAGMTFGNILIGGIIGAGVDMSTGAAYQYPDSVEHPLDCR